VSFDPKVDFTTGAVPHGLAIGDIDNDGWLDLAVANHGNGDGTTVSVLRKIPGEFAPLLEITKDGPGTADVGQAVVYTFSVSHGPSSDGSPVGNVSVTDDKAGAATRASGDDGDNLLEAGETWVYTVSYTIQPTDPDPLLNTASVAGKTRLTKPCRLKATPTV
jgi:hypothetical protein